MIEASQAIDKNILAQNPAVEEHVKIYNEVFSLFN